MGLGPELVTNGGFDTDTDWEKGSNVTIAAGKLSFDTVPCGTAYPTVALSIVVGLTYRLAWKSQAQTGSGWDVTLGGQSTGVTHGLGGYLYSDFTVTTTENLLITPAADTEGWIDDVSVKEVLKYFVG